MVTPAKDSRPLQRQDIGSHLHDAEFASGTSLIPAERALFRLGEESAETAGFQTLSSLGNCRDQLLGLGVRGTHHPEGDPLGAPRTDPGKPSELADQFSEGFGIVEMGHGTGK